MQNEESSGFGARELSPLHYPWLGASGASPAIILSRNTDCGTYRFPTELGDSGDDHDKCVEEDCEELVA
jgi:hypothetical protein